jgi:2-haloacid dehalogenase
MTLFLKLDPFADVQSGLEALKKAGKRLAILSNGSPSMIDSVIRNSHFEKHFDHLISVEDVGIYKPSRRVYRLAMQKFHIQDAPSICFVSANTWDAQAAANFGFQVVRIARTPKRDENLPGKPASIIAALTELPGLL